MKKSLQESFKEFKSSVQTLSLSTLTEEAKPNISYAPFIEDDNGNFYLFLSQLASHTQDLQLHSIASILLMQDEQDTRQLFARQRVSYQCHVEIVEKDNDESGEYTQLLKQFEKRFGSIMELLNSLPDFILFRLTPQQGRYVIGFGKAYTLTGKHLTELEHIDKT
ncbi:MAG: pyridoxamine 5'-phosphate oxidase family protein [Cocleimonas sp.]